METTLDAAPGTATRCSTDTRGRAISAGTLLLNVTSGNLMRVMSGCDAPRAGSYESVSVLGVGNVYSGGASYTVQSPLSIYANDVISVDLSAYATLTGATFTGAVSGVAPTADANFATKKYVDDAISALDDLSGVSF